MAHRFRLQAFCWVLASAVSANLDVPSVQAQSEGGEKVYQNTLRGTVWILAQRGESSAKGTRSFASGTGSLIDQTHRLVITNYHVVGENSHVAVLFPSFDNGKLVVESDVYRQKIQSGRGINGEVLARDQKHDLALIKLESVPKGAHVIYLAKDGVSPGQRVHSIGNPGRSGALWVYTAGTVRTPPYHKQWRVKDGNKVLSFDAHVVETQSPTNQGDSGGPLVNDRGELVAVTQGYATDAQLLSLFIDVSEVRSFLKSNNMLAKLPKASSAGSSAGASSAVAEKSGDQPTTDVEKLELAASTKLQLAKTLADAGKLEKAKDRYEKIIVDYPNTKAAAEAKTLLDNINK